MPALGPCWPWLSVSMGTVWSVGRGDSQPIKKEDGFPRTKHTISMHTHEQRLIDLQVPPLHGSTQILVGMKFNSSKSGTARPSNLYSVISTQKKWEFSPSLH